MFRSQHPCISLALVAVLALAGLALLPDVATACPSCKAALGSQDGGGDLVRGFFWSILFMMSMPFAILGGMSSYLYWVVRRARADQDAAGSRFSSQEATTAERSPQPERETVEV